MSKELLQISKKNAKRPVRKWIKDLTKQLKEKNYKFLLNI